MEKTSFREQIVFECESCHNEVRSCDNCGFVFDQDDIVIYCRRQDMTHYCENCGEEKKKEEQQNEQ